ncbi:MAG: hypothetical protein QG591_2001 [Planctomycetota bacterium]|nr:hypothetical protein [Planctomycetota bacterium]
MSIKVWLCDLTYTQQVISSEVMPAAVGEIATYCESHISPPPATRLFKYPEKLIGAFRTEQPHVIGFSNYVWNAQLSYEFAKVIKAKFPRTTVVMGGPNFPLSKEHQESFLRARPAIDFFIEKEGELPFCNLIRRLMELEFDIERVKKEKLGGVRAIAADGMFCAGSVMERINDLSEIPSPYLSGKLDEFFDGKLMPIIQTTRGCPFTCTYCVEGNNYYSKKFRKPSKALKAEIDYIGRKMKKVRDAGGRNDLHIADSNFGMYKEDVEASQFIADSQDRYGWPDYIICSTGKNQHERVMEVSKIVHGRIRVSGSVQSTNSVVLDNVKRKNVNLEQIFRLADDANKIGAESHSEVILGLPGDSAERHFKSIADLIDVGFTNIRMYQLILLMGTPMFAQAHEQQSEFGFGTHFRVISFDYGNYEFDENTRIVTAEIEEIVTSLKDLSYEEYFRCRGFDLVVDTFYNQGVFQALLKLLKDLDVSRFAWIKKVWESVERSSISTIIEAFITETKGELWESYDDLKRFTSKPENVAKFLSGELGGKLIFKYKSILTNEYLTELAAIARNTVIEVVGEGGKLDDQIVALVDDILSYEVLRKVNLFKGDYEPKYFTLTYDVERFLKSDAQKVPVSELKFSEPRRCRFFLENEQINAIERALNSYGRDLAAMTKIISYIRVENFYRQFEFLQS